MILLFKRFWNIITFNTNSEVQKKSPKSYVWIIEHGFVGEKYEVFTDEFGNLYVKRWPYLEHVVFLEPNGTIQGCHPAVMSWRPCSQ